MISLINDKVSIDTVWQNKLANEKSISFWEEVLVNINFDMQERCNEVVCHAHLSSKVIGITTAKIIKSKEFGNIDLFNFRILIHPKFRIPGLLDKLSVSTIDFLEQLYLKGETSAIGIITLIENPKLLERREAVFPSTGLVLAGYTAQGRQIRVRYFKGAMI